MSDVLGKVRVPMDVVIGQTTHTVEEIATMGEGTIIELNTLAGEPVSLRAAGKEIAKGEVVVIDENFGIRITQIVAEGVGNGA